MVMFVWTPLLLYLWIELCLADFAFVNPPPGGYIAGLVIQIGGTFLINWEGATGLVTLSIANGTATSAGAISYGLLQGSITGTVYPWNPNPSLEAGPYSIRATDAKGIYYSSSFLLANSTSISSSRSPSVVTSVVTSTARGGSTITTFETSTAWGATTESVSKPTSTTSSETSPASTTLTDPSIPTVQPSSGLSTGAKAGIGVGAAIGAIILFAGLALFVFKRGRRAESSAEESTAEMAAASKPVVDGRAELGGDEQYVGRREGVNPVADEVEVNRARFSELEGLEVRRPVELPVDTKG